MTNSEIVANVMFELPAIDTRTWLLRLAAAAASSALLAAAAGLIDVTMWHVAYRPASADN